MKVKMHRLFFAWQHEKEEAWLNEMAARGLIMTDVAGLRYTFEEGTPGAYIYRLELLENWPTHPESVAYIHFLEGTGVEHIGSTMRWVYFRKKAADGPFDLYSDIDSKIRHFGRIRTLLAVVGCASIPLVINNFCAAMRGVDLMWGAFAAQLLLVGVLFWGVFSISRKVRRLKKDRQLRE